MKLVSARHFLYIPYNMLRYMFVYPNATGRSPVIAWDMAVRHAKLDYQTENQ
jgi:hypothetical protein